MSAKLIRDTPAMEWGAGERITLTITPFALPPGRTVGDYTDFRLAVRRDPLWPREARNAAAPVVAAADPIADNWPVVVTATGSLVDGVPTFTFDAPSGAGARRYAFDVWCAVGGGALQVVRATWVTVLARVVPG